MEKSKMIEQAATLLGWSVEQAMERCKEKPEINALYFFDKAKGGASLLIGLDGSVLFANSSVSPEEHKKAFIKGLRTPLEAFLNK